MELLFRTLRYLGRRFRALLYWNEKLLLTYAVIVIVGAAISFSSDEAPIWPIGYHTIIWIMALIFPALAVGFYLSRVRVRANEIVDRCQRDNLSYVYLKADKYEAVDLDDINMDFQAYVMQRIRGYYSTFEFCGYSLLAAAVTFVGGELLGRQFVFPARNDPWDLVGPDWAVLVATAFLGAYAGSVVLVLRRYRTFDLRPTTFLQITVMLLAGTLAGSIVTVAFPVAELGVLAFIIAFLSAVNVTFLSQLMRGQFAKLTNTILPEDIGTDLNEVIKNTEAIEALQRISVNSVAELAESDPIRLYMNVPQDIPVIVEIIDKAILQSNFEADLKLLKKVHIHRFTHLVVGLGIRFYPEGKTKVPDIADVSIVDDGGEIDSRLLRGCTSILWSGTYHHLLGLLLHQYRNAYFEVPENNAQDDITAPKLPSPESISN